MDYKSSTVLFIKASLIQKISFVCMVLFSFTVHAQTTAIKGIVNNEKGDAIPLASVTEKGTRNIATANEKGAFTLKGSKGNAVLIVSSVGYESREYKLKGNDDAMVIVLKRNSKELDEVEVVSSGYQDIPKERATGSFVKIDNATLNQQVGTNILNRLDGVTSGLLFNIGTENTNPQNKTNITIRGLSTINGPLDPLIVLDGFIYEGDITNINPNDVDNITVLKDATAASIWGARAGNGVIVINTKKGKLGQRLRVSVSENIIVTEKPNLYYLPQMSSADYIDVEQLLFNNGYFNRRINRIYQSLTPAVQVFLDRRNGLITATDSATRINALKSIDGRQQYDQYVYRSALTQQHSVSIQGGNTNNAYNFSVGYDKNISNLRARNDKINIKMDNLFQLTPNLRINAGVYYTNSNEASGMTGYPGTVAGRQVPYLRLADDNGNPVSVTTIYRDSYIDTLGGGKLLNWKYYPLEDYKHNTSTTNLQELYANAGLQYGFTKFLSIDLKYQYQRQWAINNQLEDVESYAARDMINQFSQVDEAAGTVNYLVPLGGILTTINSSTESHTLRGQLNLNQSWKNHALSAIFGGEIRQAEANGNGSTLYGYNADPLTSSVTDYVNYYPTIPNGGYGQIPSGLKASAATINRFVSLYANASYTYKNRYSLSASARRDGSNIFGVNTNDRWKPLWSAGAAWKISDEAFYKFDPLPVLKIRATYGYSGNVDLSKSAVAVGNYYSNNAINLPFVRINVINNPNLRWEKNGIFNLGIDFGAKKNLLTGSVEFYKKYGSDLYGATLYDYTTWGADGTVVSNVAAMRGTGIDLTLNVKIIDKAFKWNTVFLFNYNTSKTTKYNSPDVTGIASKINNGTLITPFIGKPLYAIAAYKWGGLDSAGNPQGYVNGKLSTDYQAIIDEAGGKGIPENIAYVGPSSPPVFGSLINTVSWKSFSFTANIAYKFGYYFRKPSFTSDGLIQGSDYGEYEKRWKQPGDEKTTNIPAFIYPDDANRDGVFGFSTVNILRADHIRLQYINLSYSLTRLSNKLPFANIQLYANASNLGILWRANNQQIDPDYPRSIPPAKTFAFGIRGNF